MLKTFVDLTKIPVFWQRLESVSVLSYLVEEVAITAFKPLYINKVEFPLGFDRKANLHFLIGQ
jgi:hypothetical protein